MKPRALSFLPGVLWFLLSFYLLTLPGDVFPKRDWFDKIYADKLIHIAMFGILVFLFYQPYKYNWEQRSFKRIAFIIAFTALLYGVTMEFVQKYYIPNRSFDIGDIVADGIGSFLPFAGLKKMIAVRKKSFERKG